MTRNKRTLQIDKENAKWLGVCAGLANFLEVEAWTVRLVFLGCLFFGGWFLVPLYFIAWYLLDEQSGQIKESIMQNQAVRHFRTVDYRKKLYRNTQDGKLWGVCAGIADYLEISAFTVRMSFMLLTFLTGFPILFYFGALFVLEKKPEEEYSYEARSRTWTTQFHREEAGSKAKTADAGHTQQDAAAAARQSNDHAAASAANRVISIRNDVNSSTVPASSPHCSSGWRGSKPTSRRIVSNCSANSGICRSSVSRAAGPALHCRVPVWATGGRWQSRMALAYTHAALHIYPPGITP
jgi:phage shock protein PspC (stress-responsive transcriptional regulator)